ncbi:MAG: hypothetical protein IKG89_05090 [Oscillospiraceae bacterium]|nr:hypothetical protein [Oscillospiraceae bacterium]
MEEKYGKKVGTLKTSGMIYLPTGMAVVLFGIVTFSSLGPRLRGEGSWGLTIGFGIAFLIAVILLIRQAVSVNLEIYEKALVQNNLFGRTVVQADDLRAILWQFPGANPVNSRAARINNTSAELIFKDGRKSLKIQDSFYQDLEKEISAFQHRNDIPADLENKKKGGHRYE